MSSHGQQNSKKPNSDKQICTDLHTVALTPTHPFRSRPNGGLHRNRSFVTHDVPGQGMHYRWAQTACLSEHSPHSQTQEEAAGGGWGLFRKGISGGWKVRWKPPLATFVPENQEVALDKLMRTAQGLLFFFFFFKCLINAHETFHWVSHLLFTCLHLTLQLTICLSNRAPEITLPLVGLWFLVVPREQLLLIYFFFFLSPIISIWTCGQSLSQTSSIYMICRDKGRKSKTVCFDFDLVSEWKKGKSER